MEHFTWLNGLNEKQQLAVTAPVGNLVVLAGAGSGKTKVLISRFAWLVKECHISPHSILAVTFTNKAATEMKARLSGILDETMSSLWVGTFHGLCHRLLRRHFKEARLPEQFHILDGDDQARMIKRVIAALNLDEEFWPVKQAQAYINGKKDEGLRSKHIVVQSFGPGRTWLAIYKAYEEACFTAGVVDFAELLLRTHELLRDNQPLLEHYQQRFQAILVDEFQDTNTIQYAWIRLLAGERASVMAVGDDDQSIYGWRGAKIENIHKFAHDFPNTQLIRLEQNYRSSATILAAANALIENNTARMGKALWTKGAVGEKIDLFNAYNEIEEARFVSERIQMELDKGRPLLDIAILYRSNAQSRVFEDAFLRANISYRIYGGVRFFERAEIKDTLAYFRLMANIDDDAAFERIVNFPTRGIGEKTLEELRLFAKEERTSLWKAANNLLAQHKLPQRAHSALNLFIILIETMQTKTHDLALDEQMKLVISMSGLHTHFSQLKGEISESKLQNLEELVNAAKQFRYEENLDEPLPEMVKFLAHATLEAGEMQAEANESHVHMMTLHAAKGLEFPLVFLVGMEEGLFPGRQSMEDENRLEEERRLCYVGMTRAKEKLILSYAEIRRQYGREEYHRPSRFLKEMPIDLVSEVRTSKPVKSVLNQNVSVSIRHESGFNLGQNVTHAKFGQGVILAVEGNGAHTRVQVKFKSEGTKWLVLAYANLT